MLSSSVLCFKQYVYMFLHMDLMRTPRVGSGRQPLPLAEFDLRNHVEILSCVKLAQQEMDFLYPSSLAYLAHSLAFLYHPIIARAYMARSKSCGMIVSAMI